MSTISLACPDYPEAGVESSFRFSGGIPPYTFQALVNSTSDALYQYTGNSTITFWNFAGAGGDSLTFKVTDSAGSTLNCNPIPVIPSLVINAPPSASQGQPVNFAWSGGMAPFIATITSPDMSNTYLNETENNKSATWNVNLPPGAPAQLLFQVVDWLSGKATSSVVNVEGDMGLSSSAPTTTSSTTLVSQPSSISIPSTAMTTTTLDSTSSSRSTASLAPSVSPKSSPSSSHKSVAGPVAGGIIGGLTLLVGIFLVLRKRRNRGFPGAVNRYEHGSPKPSFMGDRTNPSTGEGSVSVLFPTPQGGSSGAAYTGEVNPAVLPNITRIDNMQSHEYLSGLSPPSSLPVNTAASPQNQTDNYTNSNSEGQSSGSVTYPRIPRTPFSFRSLETTSTLPSYATPPSSNTRDSRPYDTTDMGYNQSPLSPQPPLYFSGLPEVEGA